LCPSHLLSSRDAATTMGLCACDVLFQPVFMVQAAQDPTYPHTQVPWNVVSMCLQRHRQLWRRLRDDWAQRHIRTTRVIMWHPLVQETPQVVLGKGDQKVQAFTPERPQEPLTQGIRLGTPHRCFQDPEPQVPHLLIKLLGEDTVSVMDEEAIAVV